MQRWRRGDFLHARQLPLYGGTLVMKHSLYKTVSIMKGWMIALIIKK
jgi:hypothetical protein